MTTHLRALTFASVAAGLLASAASAEVVRRTVEERQPLANAKQPYEKLTGRFTAELDPKLPQNAVIADIDLAPRNARGMVEYSATFTVLKPADMSKATGVLVYQVPNRGRANIEGGNYFADFRAAGHVLVASGWQADIAAGAGIETMTAPIARNHDGSSVAATRDLIAFLRRHDADHPLGASVRYAIAQGTSQSGNYLRSFLNLGFNQDERKRRVFDGMNPNIAARQLAMNIRFAAPSGAAEMFEPGSEGALWWEDYTDTARNRPASGLLARCRASDTCPKLGEPFGSAEFCSP